MDIETFALDRKEAQRLWKEYVVACKDNPNDKFTSDMKKVYNQLKSGRKIIDIYEVFRRSGINFSGQPRLAIAKTTTKSVKCHYYKDGEVVFISKYSSTWGDSWREADAIRIKKIFPSIPKEKTPQYESKIKMEAPVPAIPASVRPKKNIDNLYILWEVDEWKPIPPRDPHLLRRITENMFVIVAGWKLTDLERAVMKGRVW